MVSRIPGVDVGWMCSLIPDIEELADALPDDCVRCGREDVAVEHECAEIGGSG